jgi:hypothetical protein
MRRQADRYAVDFSVELFAHGTERRVALADLSRTGAFLKISPPLPVGEPIHVAMFFEGRQLAAPATVVHGLGENDARALGRPPGIGIAFDPPTRHADTLFLRAVDRLIAKRPKLTAPELHVGDLRGSVKPGERVILRGDLAEIGLPAILVMLEQEKKSGRVLLRTGTMAGWFELSHGVIVDASSSHRMAAPDLRGVVMSLLDWTNGELELIINTDIFTMPSPGLSITHALIEHARICDERAARRIYA